MARLSEQIMAIQLPTLKLLQQHNIITILDFLQEDPEKISSLCALPFKEIVELRQQLISITVAPKRGLELYEELVSNSMLVQTGIKILDCLLGGGLLTGNIYEVCGLSGHGKTQLCFTIAANISNLHKQVIHYIDTKGDFSANRLSEILSSRGLSSEECKTAMNRVQVTKVNDFYELITFVEHVKDLLSGSIKGDCKLIIIDSVPAVFFPFLGNNKEGLGLLNHLMSTMKSLAAEHHVIFLVVNLSTTYAEPEDVGEDQNRLEQIKDARPMLGKYWLHAVGTRFLIQQLDPTSDERCIKIIKSNYLRVGESFNVKLQQSGVQ